MKYEKTRDIKSWLEEIYEEQQQGLRENVTRIVESQKILATLQRRKIQINENKQYYIVHILGAFLMNLSDKYKKYKAYREKSKFVKPVYIEKEIIETTYRELHRTLKGLDEVTESKFNNKERIIGSHNILEELSVEITSENKKDMIILKEKLTKEFMESKGILRVKLEQIREETFNET
ncbi:11571_t:CDS:1, partial [Acaulospora colombiana]